MGRMLPCGRWARVGRPRVVVGALVWCALCCGLSGVGCGPDDDADVDRPFRVVITGDTQAPNNDCDSPLAVPELKLFPRAILDQDPDLVLHLGDLVDLARRPDAYSRFVRCYADLLRRVPLFPTMGNHDSDWNLGAANWRAYLERQLFTHNPAAHGSGYNRAFKVRYGEDKFPYADSFAKASHHDLVPSGLSHRTFYAFSFRNLAVISMEQGASDEMNTPYAWLRKHLAAARADPRIDHIWVMMHHPLYSVVKNDHGEPWDSLAPLRRAYEALFRQYDVTLVLAGHIHLYERFYVPDDGTTTVGTVPSGAVAVRTTQGIHHLTLGPAGGFLPNTCRPFPPTRNTVSTRYAQSRDCGHNLAVVDIDGRRLSLEVKGISASGNGYAETPWDRLVLR